MKCKLDDPLDAALDSIVLGKMPERGRSVRTQGLIGSVLRPSGTHRRKSQFHVNAIRASIRRLTRSGKILCEVKDDEIWLSLPLSAEDAENA